MAKEGLEAGNHGRGPCRLAAAARGLECSARNSGSACPAAGAVAGVLCAAARLDLGGEGGSEEVAGLLGSTGWLCRRRSSVWNAGPPNYLGRMDRAIKI